MESMGLCLLPRWLRRPTVMLVLRNLFIEKGYAHSTGGAHHISNERMRMDQFIYAFLLASLFAMFVFREP